jgi:hypothetical protein
LKLTREAKTSYHEETQISAEEHSKANLKTQKINLHLATIALKCSP